MAVIGAIGIYYQRQQVRLMNGGSKNGTFHHWPLVFMIAFAASSWIPYLLRPDDLPEWPDPKPYVTEYGTGLNDCEITVSGDKFLKYRSHYRLAGSCYVYDGIGDLLDVPQLRTSKAYDIRVGTMELRTQWWRECDGATEHHAYPALKSYAARTSAKLHARSVMPASIAGILPMVE